MLFSWLQNRRRRKLLAGPFPPLWLTHLEQNVPFYACLNENERKRLQDDVRLFVAEKYWEGCAGVSISSEMQVTIAAYACLLILELDFSCYERVQSVLVYPEEYHVRREEREENGLVHQWRDVRLGEAWYRGPVVLSWAEVCYDVHHPNDGTNVVFHEFAHQLDMLDGQINGTPPLATREQANLWQEVMAEEFERLIAGTQHGEEMLLDPYGATDEGEFFAVASECFFECPGLMRDQHPKLYEVLAGFYRQDPATRFAAIEERQLRKMLRPWRKRDSDRPWRRRKPHNFM